MYILVTSNQQNIKMKQVLLTIAITFSFFTFHAQDLAPSEMKENLDKILKELSASNKEFYDQITELATDISGGSVDVSTSLSIIKQTKKKADISHSLFGSTIAAHKKEPKYTEGLFKEFEDEFKKIVFKTEQEINYSFITDYAESYTEFRSKNDELSTKRDNLKQLIDTDINNVEAKAKEVSQLQTKVDGLYNYLEDVQKFYAGKTNVDQKIIEAFGNEFSNISYSTSGTVSPKEYEAKEDSEVYVLFGSDELIAKEDILEEDTAKKIFKNVVSQASETHLGNFWFPKEGQEIPVKLDEIEKYLKDTNKFLFRKVENPKKSRIIKEYPQLTSESLVGVKEVIVTHLKFHKVEIEIFEGSLVDIRAYLKDELNNVHLFENTNSLSLLRYTFNDSKMSLINTSTQTLNPDPLKGLKCKISLNDVLRYLHIPGGNFIPDDQSLSFPLRKDDGKKTNKESSNIYELRQNTSLEHVLDLRAYTDLIGLLGDSPNGVAQFEGRADFFINPFRYKNQRVFWFKKITTYGTYSRIDDDENSLSLVPKNDTISQSPQTLNNSLDNIQKAYLKMGADINLLNAPGKKGMPFEFNMYLPFRYHVSRVATGGEESKNYKTLGGGFGLNLKTKRFENFQFNYSMDALLYNQKSFNDIENLSDPENFYVLKNEAEILYYPANSKSNSIFARFRIFDDLNDKSGSNFFQLQFGYKFSIGVSKVKSKP